MVITTETLFEVLDVCVQDDGMYWKCERGCRRMGLCAPLRAAWDRPIEFQGEGG